MAAVSSSAADAAMDIDVVANAFVKSYYSLFASKEKRISMQTLYQPTSMLTWIDKKFEGLEEIMKFFTSGILVQEMNHHVLSIDTQPSGCGGLLILVTGHVKIDDSANALYFSHSFHLIPTDKEARDWWIHNEMFKLNYG